MRRPHLRPRILPAGKPGVMLFQPGGREHYKQRSVRSIQVERIILAKLMRHSVVSRSELIDAVLADNGDAYSNRGCAARDVDRRLKQLQRDGWCGSSKLGFWRMTDEGRKRRAAQSNGVAQ